MGSVKRSFDEAAIAAPEVLDRETYFERAKQARARTNPNPQQPVILAMYNSLVDGIVTDPELMVVPLDDHALVRGHAVFDTASLCKGRVYRLRTHIDRLFNSAKLAKLKLPFGDGSEAENRKRITEIVCQTCIASGKQDGSVRYFLSAGPGNFDFTSKGCEASFYCVVFAGLPLMKAPLIDEVIVRDIPMKPARLAAAKSNNYMLNCMTAMSAQERGGKFGILLHPNDTIAEGAVVNFVCITKDREMLTPPFEGILAGTTVRKAMELAKKHLVGNLLKEVRQEVVPLSTAKAAAEIFLIGGDSHVFPVNSLEGVKVGEGGEGPVAKEILKLLLKDAEDGEDEHIVLSYAKAPRKA